MSTTIQVSGHQASPRFKGGGNHCVFNVTAASLKAMVTPAVEWTPTTVYDILGHGYELLPGIPKEKKAGILVSELPSTFSLATKNYSLILDEAMFGMLANNPSVSLFYNAEDAIKMISQYGYLTMGSSSPAYTCGIIADNYLDTYKYYVFDPHSRDVNGLSCPDGTAVLTSHLTSNINQFIFDLSKSLNISSASPFECTPAMLISVDNSDANHDCDSDSTFSGFSEINNLEFDQRLSRLYEKVDKYMNMVKEEIMPVDTDSESWDEIDPDDIPLAKSYALPGKYHCDNLSQLKGKPSPHHNTNMSCSGAVFLANHSDNLPMPCLPGGNKDKDDDDVPLNQLLECNDELTNVIIDPSNKVDDVPVWHLRSAEETVDNQFTMWCAPDESFSELTGYRQFEEIIISTDDLDVSLSQFDNIDFDIISVQEINNDSLDNIVVLSGDDQNHDTSLDNGNENENPHATCYWTLCSHR